MSSIKKELHFDHLFTSRLQKQILLSGLNTLRLLRFYGFIAIRDCVAHASSLNFLMVYERALEFWGEFLLLFYFMA